MNPLRPLILALLMLATLAANAARDDDDVIYRREIGVVAGTNFMLSDTNNRPFGSNNLTGGALLRFVLNPRMAIKTIATYSRVKGEYKPDQDFYPQPGEGVSTDPLVYSYDGGVIDLSAMYELHFLPYGYVRDYQGFKRITPFIQLGLGLHYGTIAKTFGLNIPIGVGLKFKASRRLNLALDCAMHFNLTDKLDGLEAPTGIKTEMFRGKDHYFHTLLTLTYDISPRCPTCNKD